MKAMIFDSSSIITLSMNNLLGILYELKKDFKGKFIVPHAVKYETVKHPLTIKKFKLNAMYVSKLFKDGIFETPEAIGINDEEISKEREEIKRVSNSLFYSGQRAIHLIDEGESECLALAISLNERGIENMITIDERTTRLLGENPENLKKILEKKLHSHISKREGSNQEILKKIKKIKFIRSTELVFVAYEKGMINPKEKDFLDAMLYATRFKGASISDEEIAEIEKAS